MLPGAPQNRTGARRRRKALPENPKDSLTRRLSTRGLLEEAWTRGFLRAGVQHRDRTTVLRPARDVVADRDRALLAVGDRPHPRGIDAARGQEGANRLGTAGAERDVVFARSALIRMAFDGEGVARISLQPLRLLFQGGDRLRREIGLVALEEHAVADIDHEILLAPRGRGARHRIGAEVLVGAGAHRQRYRQHRGQPQSLEDTHLVFHSGASTLTFSTVIRSTGGWLNERSVNLDGVLPEPLKCPQTAKSNRGS